MLNRLALMETFVCVVQTGSFSAAAQRLNVGQPAISKAIALLEKHLGTRLLIRSTRGQKPTEGGQAFYEGALKAIEQANFAEQTARASGSELAGVLRVSAAVTFARLHIIPRLHGFLNAHPELSIDIVLDDGHIDLVEQGIDVALRMGKLLDSSMTAKKIATVPRSVMASPRYLEKYGMPTTPSDLGEHAAVIYSSNSAPSGPWVFTQQDQALSVNIQGRIKVSAAEGVRAAVLADLGFTIASEWMFSPELASGEVVTLLNDWQLPPFDLWALFPTGRMVSAKTRAFVSFVEQIIQP
jgi:DNA-binding transcriptional LysR family regulator